MYSKLSLSLIVCPVPNMRMVKAMLFGAVGFTIAIVIMAGIREKIEYNAIPKPFQGSAIVLVTAGLMAIAFMGFSGVI